MFKFIIIRHNHFIANIQSVNNFHIIPIAQAQLHRSADSTAVGDSIEVLNMDVINLDLEGFEYKQVSVPLDECCLIYQWTNTPLRTHSRVHEGFESCWILGPQARGSLDGADLHSYALIAAGSGADGELIAESGYENVGWLVPPQEIAVIYK